MIKRVGLAMIREFEPGTDPANADVLVETEFEEGAEVLERLLNEGYTVVTSSTAKFKSRTSKFESVTFLFIVLYKSGKDLES